MKHKFILSGVWQGGLQGGGKIACGNLETEIAVPKEMSGTGLGTNPEELLVGAASSCYLITLGAVLERRKIPVKSLSVSSEIAVDMENGLKVTHLIHRPKLTLDGAATEAQKKSAQEATELAEKYCLISNALRGNVEMHVEAEISVV